MYDDANTGVKVVKWSLIIIGLILVLFMFVFPITSIWRAEQSGRAQLAEAEYSKKVAVETAKAKLEAASYEADAEVRRAEGVAKANQIIGQSLHNNEVYLKYLWINALNERVGDREIVYIPTEANIPILEAGKGAK